MQRSTAHAACHPLQTLPCCKMNNMEIHFHPHKCLSFKVKWTGLWQIFWCCDCSFCQISRNDKTRWRLWRRKVEIAASITSVKVWTVLPKTAQKQVRRLDQRSFLVRCGQGTGKVWFVALIVRVGDFRPASRLAMPAPEKTWRAEREALEQSEYTLKLFLPLATIPALDFARWLWVTILLSKFRYVTDSSIFAGYEGSWRDCFICFDMLYSALFACCS